MMKQFAKLIDLKTIVTLAITVGVLYGFIVGKIDAAQFMILVVMVYTFYFNKDKKDTTTPPTV